MWWLARLFLEDQGWSPESTSPGPCHPEPRGDRCQRGARVTEVTVSQVLQKPQACKDKEHTGPRGP